MGRLSVFALAAVLGVLLVPVAMPGGAGRALVIRYRDDQFGPILATQTKQALYYWSVEKRAGGKVKCTGRCAKAWPPLIVRSRKAVPTRIAGIRGTFGTVRRPEVAPHRPGKSVRTWLRLVAILTASDKVSLAL